MGRTAEIISAALLALALLIVAVVFAVYLVSSPPVVRAVAGFTHSDEARTSSPTVAPLTREERVAAAAMTSDFVRFRNHETEMIEFFRRDEGAGLESIGHLLDVRDVFARTWVVGGIAFVLIIAAATVAHRADAGDWMGRALRIAACLCLVIPLVLGIITAAAFGPLFTFFHQVFFPQGNWRFAHDSYLIQLFPEPFWIVCASLVLGISMLAGAFWWFLSGLLRRSKVAC